MRITMTMRSSKGDLLSPSACSGSSRGYEDGSPISLYMAALPPRHDGCLVRLLPPTQSGGGIGSRENASWTEGPRHGVGPVVANRKVESGAGRVVHREGGGGGAIRALARAAQPPCGHAAPDRPTVAVMTPSKADPAIQASGEG